MGVDMATNTDDTAEIDKGVAANVRPMYSVGTSPPNSNANVNNNQVVVYNNNNVNNGSVFALIFVFLPIPSTILRVIFIRSEEMACSHSCVDLPGINAQRDYDNLIISILDSAHHAVVRDLNRRRDVVIALRPLLAPHPR